MRKGSLWCGYSNSNTSGDLYGVYFYIIINSFYNNANTWKFPRYDTLKMIKINVFFPQGESDISQVLPKFKVRFFPLHFSL